MNDPSLPQPGLSFACPLVLASTLWLLSALASATPLGEHRGHLNVCMPISASSPGLLRILDAATAAGQIYKLKRISVDDPVELSAEIEAGRARATELPQHGALSEDPAIGYGFLYTPDSGYLGSDRATFAVSIGNDFVDVTFHLEVVAVEIEKADEYMKFFSAHCPRAKWMEGS